MVSVEGWICRSCWKPNRTGAARCYHCKTERAADEQTVEARRRELADKRANFERRQDSAAGVVGVLPATVFRWYGRLMTLGGVLYLFLVPFVLMDSRDPLLGVAVVGGIGLGAIALGAAMRWASGAMRTANPWGFVVGLVISVVAVLFTFYALSNLPVGTGNPNWMRFVSIGVFSISGILALVGLLYSLRGDQRAA